MTTITVQEILTTATRNGGTMYRIAGHDGVKYGYGFDKPAFEVGDVIEFEESNNGAYKNIKKGTAKKVADPVAAPVAAPSGGSGKANANFREPDTIIVQESLTQAIEVIKFAIEQGALKLPTKVNEKYDALNAIVGELTNEFAWKAKHPKIMDPEEYAMMAAAENDTKEGEVVEDK